MLPSRVYSKTASCLGPVGAKQAQLSPLHPCPSQLVSDDCADMLCLVSTKHGAEHYVQISLLWTHQSKGQSVSLIEPVFFFF